MGYASSQYYNVVANWLRNTENYTTNSTDYQLSQFNPPPTPTLKIVHLCDVLGPCFFKAYTKLLLTGIY